MEIIKEYKQRVGGNKMTVSFWDDGSVDIEYDGAMISFDTVASLKCFLATLEDDVKSIS